MIDLRKSFPEDEKLAFAMAQMECWCCKEQFWGAKWRIVCKTCLGPTPTPEAV